jgi:hypothetical protein
MEKHKKEEQNPRISLVMLQMHKIFSRRILADIVIQKPNSNPRTPKAILEYVKKNKNYFECIEAYDKEYDKIMAKLKRKIKAENKKSRQKNEPSI